MKPKNLQELVEFYYEFVKPLYSAIQLTNELPSEVLFEINAAFDHVTRHWAYGESEADVVSKAHSHLKRSCLDIFKLSVRNAVDQFDELKLVDTSIIDNGEFDRKLTALMAAIKSEAKAARQSEGDPRKEDKDAIGAFDLWFPVYEKCVQLEKDFYDNPSIVWANKISSRDKWKERIIFFVLGIIAALIASYIYDACKSSPQPLPILMPQTSRASTR